MTKPSTRQQVRSMFSAASAATGFAILNLLLLGPTAAECQMEQALAIARFPDIRIGIQSESDA
jgi:hypothetical protein